MTIDFHVHSTASDGTLSPDALVRLAARNGLAALALTDHDNVAGLASFHACAAADVRRVSGVELSIEPGRGFDRFHLLGLGVDPCHPALQALFAEILEGRNRRNQRITENFHRLGLDIRPEPHGEILARPHYARWLVEHGHAADIAEAFVRYLSADSPRATRCYETRWHPPQARVFAAVHQAGGLAVMAHPKYWCNSWKDDGCDYGAAARELARLKEVGLDGVEAFYQANTPEENAHFLRITRDLGLLVSAGSDFHGANKPSITLGMRVEEGVIRPLLERLNLF